MKVVLVIEYDGTNYSGWQYQENAKSVQGEIEHALFCITGETIRLHGAGRTDAGVHALGQVAHFDTGSTIPPDRFSYALSAVLPEDIGVVRSFEANDAFHARFSATGKHYRYVIRNTRARAAVMRNYCMTVGGRLDVEKMREGAAYMVGTHDFASFCAANTQVKDTVRTVERVDIREMDDTIRIDVYGTGFLYNMVRIMAGTLIDVGRARITPQEVEWILAQKDRRKASATAQARGLFLVEVFYADSPELPSW